MSKLSLRAICKFLKTTWLARTNISSNPGHSDSRARPLNLDVSQFLLPVFPRHFSPHLIVVAYSLKLFFPLCFLPILWTLMPNEYFDAVVTKTSEGRWDESPMMATPTHLRRFGGTEACAWSTVFPVTHAVTSGTMTLGFQLRKVVGEDTTHRKDWRVTRPLGNVPETSGSLSHQFRKRQVTSHGSKVS